MGSLVALKSPHSVKSQKEWDTLIKPWKKHHGSSILQSEQHSSLVPSINVEEFLVLSTAVDYQCTDEWVDESTSQTVELKRLSWKTMSWAKWRWLNCLQSLTIVRVLTMPLVWCTALAGGHSCHSYEGRNAYQIKIPWELILQVPMSNVTKDSFYWLFRLPVSLFCPTSMREQRSCDPLCPFSTPPGPLKTKDLAQFVPFLSLHVVQWNRMRDKNILI